MRLPLPMAEGNLERQVNEKNHEKGGCRDWSVDDTPDSYKTAFRGNGVTAPRNGVSASSFGATSNGATPGPVDESWIHVNTAEIKPLPVLRQLSAKDVKVLRPLSVLSWETGASSNSHLWYSVDTSEPCYFSGCSDHKAVKEGKVRCSACSAVAHFGCKAPLVNLEGLLCKETFREIKQKVKDVTVFHHFLQHWRATGRCRHCGKGFGTRMFSVKEVVFCCSWCGDSYHPACISDHIRGLPCHMGPLRAMIVPPSWIVRTPLVESGAQTPEIACSEPDFTDASHMHDHTHNPTQVVTAKQRKNSKKKRSIYGEDRASKFFVVKPIMQEHSKPLVVFVNPKSGGNQGAKLLQTFHLLLNPRQVFDLSKEGPTFGLKMFIHVPNVRILVCGGDGTAGWILSVLDEILELRKQQFDRTLDRPPMAVLPLGTGNDLARVLGWGGGYSGGSLERVLQSVEKGKIVNLDRWLLFVVPNEAGPHYEVEQGAVKDTPLHVVNNYFSIGSDASVALEFHLGREANPDKYKTRIENKFHYTKLGSKDMVQRKFTTLTDYISLKGDGVDYTEKLQQLKIETLCFLNIPSYASGTNPWGHPTGEDKNISPQAIDDGVIEVVGFWATSMAMLQVGLGHGVRIAQCQHIKMVTTKCLPVQVDGEACMLTPSTIIIIMKNKVPMVMRGELFPTMPPEDYPQDRIQLSVYKISIEVYENCSSFQQARKLGTEIGFVMAALDCTLRDIRVQVSNLLPAVSNGTDNQGWSFLNAVNGGMQQVQREDELSLRVEDMPLDGLVILEAQCRSPTLQLDEAEPSPKTVSADVQRFKAETEQFHQWNIHKTILKAAMKGDLACLMKLHEQGHSLFIVDNLHRSPLHYAARNGKQEIVQYLMKNISEEQINLAETESGQTPLHKAAIHDHVDICRILVDNGASISLQDAQGNTPYTVAIEHSSVRVQRYLKGLMVPS